jgi:hypothetical protein
MLVWILGSQPLGAGSSEQIIVGGDEHEARQRISSGKCCGKLHRIVATQTMCLSEIHGLIRNRFTSALESKKSMLIPSAHASQE